MDIETPQKEEELWRRGLLLFNQAQFFECHEVLEELWNKQVEPEKKLTQALIQIAVGYLHLQRGNEAGARKLLEKGWQKLQPFRPAGGGINLDELSGAVAYTLELLRRNSRENKAPPQLIFTREP